MIKILMFVFGVLVSIEYLVDIERELWKTSFLSNVSCFLSGASFGNFLSLHYPHKLIKQSVAEEIDSFFLVISNK